MAILGVGVFNGVVINKITASKNDKGLAQSIDVTFKKLGEVGSGDDLDFLNSGEITSSDAGKENNIRIYSVNSLQGYDGNDKTGDDLLNEVMARRDQLVHIAQAYMTSDKIKFELTKGLGVKNKTELKQKITNPDTLAKMNDNMFTQFVALMTPVIGEDSKRVVVKFLRKSKTSNFPRLSDKKLDWNPFIAAEDDKALVAKVKFSDWENENGWSSNAQSLESADATPEELAAQTAAANNVFND